MIDSLKQRSLTIRLHAQCLSCQWQQTSQQPPAVGRRMTTRRITVNHAKPQLISSRCRSGGKSLLLGDETSTETVSALWWHRGALGAVGGQQRVVFSGAASLSAFVIWEEDPLAKASTTEIQHSYWPSAIQPLWVCVWLECGQLGYCSIMLSFILSTSKWLNQAWSNYGSRGQKQPLKLF